MFICGYLFAQEGGNKEIEEYFNKGMEKAKKGDYVGAIQDFNKVLEKDSDNVGA